MGWYLPRAPLSETGQWSDLALLICALIALIQIIRGQMIPVLTDKYLAGALAFALFFAAWTALSTAVNGSSWWLTLGTFELATIYWLTTQVTREPGLREKILRVWIISATALGALGFIGVGLDLAGFHTPMAGLGGAFSTRLRIHGPCISPNMLASLCLVPWLALYAPTGRRLFKSGTRYLLLLFLSCTLLFTLSHALLAVALGVLLLRARKSKPWLITGVLLLLTLDFLSMRFHWTSAELGLAPSLTPGLRWIILGQAWHNVALNPIFGSGPDSLAAVVTGFPTPDSPDTGLNAHCTPLAIAVTLGLPALLAFGGFIWLALRHAFAKLKPTDEFTPVLIVACFAMLFDALTSDHQHGRHFWLLLGLL